MEKNLAFKELIAIAVGGMVGGGIFTILGIAVSMVGVLAPFAIALGGVLAFLAAYSYVKLGIYYKDEGATYAFFKRTYPRSHLAASFIGWYTIFGYISTLALYAYTFSAYALSSLSLEALWIQKVLALGILWLFTAINLWSVKGMGKLEDIMVYSKLIILLVIALVLGYYGKTDLDTFTQTLALDWQHTSFMSIMIVASVTFVAYEGFQLVINAVNEMEIPEKNIPKAIYSAIFLVALFYFIIAMGAVLAISTQELIVNKEDALAAGAYNIMGTWGKNFVILGAILATSSAISGTMFGSSRQMARIAEDGYLPKQLSYRKNHIPHYSIMTMSLTASLLILAGGLELILEFGSITFLLVSLLMAIANFNIRKKTNSSTPFTLIAIAGLMLGTLFILYYEYQTKPEQLLFIIGLYALLSLGAWSYAKVQKVL
jgi:amino acid transporter